MTDVLIFIEDPGAANCVCDLPDALRRLGLDSRLMAMGAGLQQLDRLGVSVAPVATNTSADELIDAQRPSLILVGTSENPQGIGLALVAAARRRGIRSIGMVDGPANPEYRFRGISNDPLAFVPDHVLVPEALTAAAFQDLGLARSRLTVTGHPLYDRIRTEHDLLSRQGRAAIRARVFPDIAKDSVVVAFLTEISDGLDPGQFMRSAEYSLDGRGDSELRTHIVLQEFLDGIGELSWRPYVVLRLHPKDDPQEYKRYGHEVDRVSRDEPVWELLFACDLVVGMTTHLMLEAALLGVPTLSVLPRSRERCWLVAIGLGITTCVEDRDSLRIALRQVCCPWDGLSGPVAADRQLASGATGRVARLLARLHGNIDVARGNKNNG